jgi:hypothetical protein
MREYDAAQVVVRFNETTLRQEVDLDQVCKHLLTVVQETMQPTTLSLWLLSPKPPEEPEQSRTQPPRP